MSISPSIATISFAVAISFTAPLQAVERNGGPSRSEVTPAAAPTPFKKDCAAAVKNKFAASYHRGFGADCAFGGVIGPSKNVDDFTHPATGVFCFLPGKKSGLSKVNAKTGVTVLDRTLPSVNVEWFDSLGFQLLAFHLREPFDCPADYLEVRTYDFSSGSAVLSDSVAFNIVAN